ncbi:hypothetical protein HS7_20670 [Sulfolobales archaeon HS-7]|nr:hypothetical protein HS7_20670 [Sulfolobales archaeon HS-7]
MGNRKMEYRGQKIPEKDVYYFEIVLMIKNKESFNAEIEGDLAMTVYNYVISTANEISIDYSEIEGIEKIDYIYFYSFDPKDKREYVVTMEDNLTIDPSNTDDVVEAITKAKRKVTWVRLHAFTKVKQY